MTSAMERELLELALELVRLPTTPGREGLALEFLAERLQGAGLKVWEQEVPGVGKNLLASRGEGGIWFVTHLDVFPPLDHPHPFSPEVRGGKLFGRGAVDTKGQIAALLWSLSRSRGPAQVALVVDEELLGRGSEALEVPEGIVGAVVLEPTGLYPCPAEAGTLEVRVTVSGRAAHGTTPWAGDNAILKALEDFRRFLTHPIFSHRHPLFPRGAWVNLGRIEGGYDPMVVPASCAIHFDVGFAPGLSPVEVLGAVRQAFTDPAVLEVLDVSPPWEIPHDAPILRRLQRAIREALGEELPLGGMPSWTDAANLFAKGVNPVVFGAGSLEVAHTPHEAIPLRELKSLAQVLLNLLED